MCTLAPLRVVDAARGVSTEVPSYCTTAQIYYAHVSITYFLSICFRHLPLKVIEWSDVESAEVSNSYTYVHILLLYDLNMHVSYHVIGQLEVYTALQ